MRDRLSKYKDTITSVISGITIHSFFSSKTDRKLDKISADLREEKKLLLDLSKQIKDKKFTP